MGTYVENVLKTNKELKKASKTVGGSRAILLSLKKEAKLPQKFEAYLRLSKKDSAVYEELNKACRRSKAGNVTPFFVLQALERLTKEPKKETQKADKLAKVGKVPATANKEA